MHRAIRLLSWLVYWAYKIMWVGAVGFALSFVSARAGHMIQALAIALATLACITLIVALRASELARVRKTRAATIVSKRSDRRSA